MDRVKSTTVKSTMVPSYSATSQLLSHILIVFCLDIYDKPNTLFLLFCLYVVC